MKKPNPTPKPVVVTPVIGEPYRFQCVSRSSPEVKYNVDLRNNKGSGSCDCKRFVCVAKPRLDAGEPGYNDRTSCAHLRACWTWWMRQSLKP